MSSVKCQSDVKRIPHVKCHEETNRGRSLSPSLLNLSEDTLHAHNTVSSVNGVYTTQCQVSMAVKCQVSSVKVKSREYHMSSITKRDKPVASRL